MARAPSPRAPRRDAVRNRAALVAAAAAAFREHGLGVSVNAIARDAGVNVATLYRHFPAKDDLVAAVFETVLEPIAAARDRALREAAPGELLAVFVHEVVREQAAHRGLVEVLLRQPDAAVARGRLREPSIAIVAPVVERAHRDGELRADFDAEDLLIFLSMLAVVPGAADPAARDRYVDVVVRGLSPRG